MRLLSKGCKVKLIQRGLVLRGNFFKLFAPWNYSGQINIFKRNA